MSPDYNSVLCYSKVTYVTEFYLHSISVIYTTNFMFVSEFDMTLAEAIKQCWYCNWNEVNLCVNLCVATYVGVCKWTSAQEIFIVCFH